MPNCKTCSDTGLVPFIKPDGTRVKYAQVTCPDCDGYTPQRIYEDAHRPDAQPDDFDFPCSESWRRYYNGERSEHAVTAIPQASRDTLDNRRWDAVQQLRAEVQFLRKKVTEKRIEKRPQKRYEKYT